MEKSAKESMYEIYLPNHFSSGPYTAGVLDFLIEALNAARENGENKLPIFILKGDGVFADIFKRVINKEFSPVKSPSSLSQLSKSIPSNPLYHIWVDHLDEEGAPSTEFLSFSFEMSNRSRKYDLKVRVSDDFYEKLEDKASTFIDRKEPFIRYHTDPIAKSIAEDKVTSEAEGQKATPDLSIGTLCIAHNKGIRELLYEEVLLKSPSKWMKEGFIRRNSISLQSKTQGQSLKNRMRYTQRKRVMSYLNPPIEGKYYRKIWIDPQSYFDPTCLDEKLLQNKRKNPMEIKIQSGDFYIKPTRYSFGNFGMEKIEDIAALSCSSVHGLGGLLSKKFRKHDFFLGRTNCEKFLRDHFKFSLSDSETTAEPSIDSEYRSILAVTPPPNSKLLISKERAADYVWPKVRIQKVEAIRGKIRKEALRILKDCNDLSRTKRLQLYIQSKACWGNEPSMAIMDTIEGSLYSHYQLKRR